MSITLYGIPNCDSVKKARALLDSRGVAHVFHDYKKQGVPEAKLGQWIAAKGRDAILNRKGTTWRSLDEAVKASVVDDESALRVMLANPSTIKRPVVEVNRFQTTTILVGFDAQELNGLM